MNITFLLLFFLLFIANGFVTVDASKTAHENVRTLTKQIKDKKALLTQDLSNEEKLKINGQIEVLTKKIAQKSSTKRKPVAKRKKPQRKASSTAIKKAAVKKPVKKRVITDSITQTKNKIAKLKTLASQENDPIKKQQIIDQIAALEKRLALEKTGKANKLKLISNAVHSKNNITTPTEDAEDEDNEAIDNEAELDMIATLASMLAKKQRDAAEIEDNREETNKTTKKNKGEK